MDGALGTAMEVENLKHTHIEPNSIAFRNTRRVDTDAIHVGVLSPAKKMNQPFSPYTQLARSRGVSIPAAEAHHRMMHGPPSMQLMHDDRFNSV
jgi:hypothetical protein